MTDLGLIFDMDGVVVNNHEYHFLAWQQLAGRYDIQIDEEFYREKMNGRTLMELMDIVFAGRVEKSKAREIGLQKEVIYRDLYRDFLEPTQGLINLLEAGKSKNIPMVVGTSAPIENVEFTLDGLNLRSYFVGVVDDRMVKKGKPDPEVYLNCAKMIGRKPENCIVFEDAVAGIQAGKNAGSKVVALATSHRREELSADLIIDDFTQLSWEQIEELHGK